MIQSITNLTLNKDINQHRGGGLGRRGGKVEGQNGNLSSNFVYLYILSLVSGVGKKSVLMQILLISNWVHFLTGNTNFNTILQLRKKKKKRVPHHFCSRFGARLGKHIWYFGIFTWNHIQFKTLFFSYILDGNGMKQ